MPPKGTKKNNAKKAAPAPAPSKKHTQKSIERMLSANAALAPWGNVAANSPSKLNVAEIQHRMALAAAELTALKQANNTKRLARIAPIRNAAAHMDDLKDLWLISGRCTCDLLNGPRGAMPECTCFPEGMPMAQWPAPPAPKPRAGKVMRECMGSDVTHLHAKTGEPCKFVHKDEPEFAMLRADQLRGAPRPAKPAKKATSKGSKGGSRRKSNSWFSSFF
jgi:hypothetical protein